MFLKTNSQKTNRTFASEFKKILRGSKMSHSHPNKHIPYCLNCHYPLAEMDRFCPNCGQKPTDGKTTMHDLIHEFVHTLFHLDGKFFTTLKHIFVPGKLTTEFFKGHHKRYAHPVQLFLVLGALLFGMIASSTNKLEKSIEEKQYKSHRKVEEKAFLQLIDSISDVTAPIFEGKKTKQAYDALLMRAHKHSLKQELKSKKNGIDDTEKIKKGNDTIYFYAGGLLKVTKENEGDSELDTIATVADTGRNGNMWGEFKDGFKEGWNNHDQKEKTPDETIDSLVDNNLKQLSLKEILTQEDSTLISQLYSSVKIPTRELYELSADQILEKYKIKGFWERLSLKQAIKAQQGPKNLLHFIMGKLLWFTLLLIPMMSGLFMLLYRKKNYFVEHFIFFMHYNIFLFTGLILLLFVNDKFGNNGYNKWFFLTVFVFFYFAMKNYYQQSWGKTFVKYLIANLGYFFFTIILTTLGAIVSFLLF